jgi:hypothetical protein
LFVPWELNLNSKLVASAFLTRALIIKLSTTLRVS